MKTCTKCGTERQLTEFNKAPQGKNGLISTCKACERAYKQATRPSARASRVLRNCGRQAPSWLTQDQLAEMRDAYWEAARLTEQTGVAHEVDHIVPRTSEVVSGLHVPWNLQVLTRTENRKKGNRLEGHTA